MNLNSIESKINSLNTEVASLKGKLSLLEDQHTESTERLLSLKDEQVLNIKSVELLNIVQKATKELIQDLFQGVVSKALQYVHQNNNYNFELEFDRHGNVPKMSFLMKTPDMQESHEILDTRAGGSKDIIALALRLVLLEIARNTGFVFLDEPCKRLDNEETIKKTIEFLKETQKETNRQFFIITHKNEIVDSVENPIVIK
jgi:ABC-type glutathione transport system ATPase component